MSKVFPKTKYKICGTLKEVKQLIEYVKIKRIASIDFETSGDDWWKEGEYPTMLGISFQPGSAYIIPLAHFDSPFLKGKQWIKILQLVSREILQNTDIVKFAWNVKFEWKWLLKYGCSLQGRVFDVMLAKYLLDENSRNGLKENVASMMPEYAGYDNEIDELEKKHRQKGSPNGWRFIPLKPLAKYCGIDCDLTLRLMMVYHPVLIKKGFYQLFRNMLMMAIRTLTESEFHGLPVDVPYIHRMVKKYDGLIDKQKRKLMRVKGVKKFIRGKKTTYIDKLIATVRKEIAEIQKGDKPTKANLIRTRQDKIVRYLAGNFTTKKELKVTEGLNFGSPHHIKELLYTSGQGFKLPIIKYTKNNYTKVISNNPSTDEDTLQQFLDGVARKCDERNRPIGPIIKITETQREFLIELLELRGLEKMQSTNIRGMLKFIDKDGLIHANFHLLTVTGRLGCRDPNLQNIPRVTTNPDIKPMFIPPKGMLIGEVDYSQAELRIVAEVAKDKAMIDIFKRNYNIHVATAAINNGGIEQYETAKSMLKRADELTSEQLRKAENTKIFKWVKEKKRAKTINFGILYGEGAPKLSKELGCSEREAEAYITRWLKGYPGVGKWIKNQHRKVNERGYVKTIWGRKRRLPDIWHEYKGKRMEAQRQSVNSPIQSAASDFTLFSTIVLREKRLTGELPSWLVQLYTVHDSIGYPMYPKYIIRIMPIIVKVCDNPDTMKWFGFEMKYVSMKVSPEIGKNWGSLKDFNPWEQYQKWVA